MNLLLAPLWLLFKFVVKLPLLALFLFALALTIGGAISWWWWLIPVVGMTTVIVFGMSFQQTWVAPYFIPPVRDDDE